jgi:hypothetical protein
MDVMTSSSCQVDGTAYDAIAKKVIREKMDMNSTGITHNFTLIEAHIDYLGYKYTTLNGNFRLLHQNECSEPFNSVG